MEQLEQGIIATSLRLTLRRLLEADSDAVFQYRQLPEVALFQSWTPKNTDEVVEHALLMASNNICQPDMWEQIVLVNACEQVIGDLAVCIDSETEKLAELGIALAPAFQRKGLATEAINTICDWLFQHKDLHRISVSIDPRNTASLNLFARVGFRQEAHHRQSCFFKGEWCDDIVMAILQSEWQENRNH
ncbi:MAG: GNAT family protein [Kangiellaceae bacterium]